MVCPRLRVAVLLPAWAERELAGLPAERLPWKRAIPSDLMGSGGRLRGVVRSGLPCLVFAVRAVAAERRSATITYGDKTTG